MSAVLIFAGIVLGWLLKSFFEGLSLPPKTGFLVRASSPEEAIEASGLPKIEDLQPGPPHRIIRVTWEAENLWRVESEFVA